VTAMLAKRMKQEVQEKMDALKKKLLQANPNFRLDVLLVEGHASERIVQIANEEKADLIVMGSTGKGKIKKAILGSTSFHIVKHAACPVLCIPAAVKYNGIKKIVFATDLKEDNLNAALAITAFARNFNAEIIFVYVDNAHDVLSDEYIAEMTKKIRSRVNYNKMSGYIAKSKNIAEGIRYFLKHHQTDMLVMLTHQKHFPESVFSTTVTGNVLESIQEPLLALPVTNAVLA
jgi:nucleotide-binding universal stress UspA family protein